MSLTRVEPTSIDSNATFVFANATVNSNLITANLNANIVTANRINFSGVANLGAVANVKISGGTSNQVLITDGSSNLRWGVPDAAVANTVAIGAQPNITSLGNLTNIVISNTNPGVSSPVNITETWNNSSISFTGIGLNVIDSNSSTGSNLLNLSVNNISRFAVTKTGNISAANATLGNTASANFLAGTLTTSFQPNITSIGQLSLLNVTGNITGGNATISGSMYGAVQGVIGGQTPNSATFTSVNINNTASISGNLTAANSNLGNAARANFFIGDGSLLSNVNVGSISNANYSNFAGTVTNSSQPNITSVGNLTSVNVDGNVTGAAVRGTLVTANLLNVNTAATIFNLSVSGDTQLTSLVAKSSVEYMLIKNLASGSINYDYLEGTVYYHTLNGNVAVNFINVPASNTLAAVFVLAVQQGTTPYSFTSVSIGGTVYTIKWLGGVAPTATANKLEVYSFTLFRTGATTWTVAGQMNSYG
jgi:hypothetical protein